MCQQPWGGSRFGRSASACVAALRCCTQAKQARLRQAHIRPQPALPRSPAVSAESGPLRAAHHPLHEARRSPRHRHAVVTAKRRAGRNAGGWTAAAARGTSSAVSISYRAGLDHRLLHDAVAVGSGEPARSGPGGVRDGSADAAPDMRTARLTWSMRTTRSPRSPSSGGALA